MKRIMLFAVICLPLLLINAVSQDNRLQELDQVFPTISNQLTFLQQSGSTINIDRLHKYALSDNSEVTKAVALVVNSNHYSHSETQENLTLGLLLTMLNKNCYRPDDPVTACLVMANNFIYFQADKQTRNQIIKDMVDHYKLYEDIVAWQNKEGYAWTIENVPAIPKIFWAARYRFVEYWYVYQAMKSSNRKQIQLKEYMEFFDRVETLRSIHEELKDRQLTGRSFSQTIRSLENAAGRNHKYR